MQGEWKQTFSVYFLVQISGEIYGCCCAFLHSPDGVIRKDADMPIEWQAWTADKERFITFDADAKSQQIRMNSTELVRSPDDVLRELDAWNHPPTIDYIKYFIIYSYQHNWY